MSGELFKSLGLCLVTAALCAVLKQKNSEYALLAAVAAGTAVTILLLKCVAAPIEAVRYKLESYGIEADCFKTAIKAVGIGYVTSFVSDACRDSGQSSLAAKAELAGKCAIFLITCPMILSVLETAVGLIK